MCSKPETNPKSNTGRVSGELGSFQCGLSHRNCRIMTDVLLLYFDPRPGPKMLFQGDAPEGSDTFQWPVVEGDRVGGLRLMIWDKVRVPLCHYSDTPEESDL